MSSLASGMNSSCAVITEDFVGRFLAAPLPEVKRVRLARFISCGIGVTVILLSLLVSRIEGNLIDLCYRAVNLMTAPLFVLFFLAMFAPSGHDLWLRLMVAARQAAAAGGMRGLSPQPLGLGVAGASCGSCRGFVRHGRTSSAAWPVCCRSVSGGHDRNPRVRPGVADVRLSLKSSFTTNSGFVIVRRCFRPGSRGIRVELRRESRPL